MRLLWFCSYPVSRLEPLPVKHSAFNREHPASWTVNLSAAVVAKHPEVELHIAVLNAEVKHSFSIQRDGITCHVVKSQHILPFGRHWPPFEWNVSTGYREYRTRLCKVAERINPDVILAFGTEDAYALAAKDSGKPYMIYIQGILHELAKVFPADKKISIRLPLEKKAMEQSRCYFAESGFGERFARAMNPGATVWRVGNSVADAYFSARHIRRMHHRLLYLGDILPGKGIAELLAAVDRNGWRLTVAGEDPRKYPQALKKQYRHNQNIEWLGRIPAEAVADLMVRHDALVLPSYMDTSPYVVAEAMAAGLPVIASRVGGIPDMVTDGETGILIEPKSVESLVQGIKRLYDDPEKMLTMGEAARRTAFERFRPDRNAQILVEACCNVAAVEKEMIAIKKQD